MSTITNRREHDKAHHIVMNMVITPCPHQVRISDHVEALSIHAEWVAEQEDAA